MWRDEPPITGRARITGSRRHAGIAATFSDADGREFVFQLAGAQWGVAIDALSFRDDLAAEGLDDLGVVHESEAERKRLFDKLDQLFATGSRDRWVDLLRQADIVSAPVNTMLEASKDPDMLANGYVAKIDYPDFEKTLPVHGAPWKFSETPAEIRHAPALGEHNSEVLTELGYTATDLADLDEAGII